MISNHAEMLMRHGIDYEDALDRFGGNVALYEKFIMRFLNDAHYYDDLKHALMIGECETGFRSAHSLKGVVGNLSFVQYFHAVDEVAEALRAGDISLARSIMPAVDYAHRDVVTTLDKILCVSQT